MTSNSAKTCSHTRAVVSICWGSTTPRPAANCAHVTIRDNLVLDISGKNWGGAGMFVQMGGEPAYITIDHNTVLHTGNAVLFYSGVYMNSSNVQVPGGPIKGFVFTNNLLHHNVYGIFGDGKGNGNAALAYYAPGAVVQRNVMATDKDQSSKYPPDNQFPTLAAYNANFVNAAAGDFRLLPGSAYVGGEPRRTRPRLPTSEFYLRRRYRPRRTTFTSGSDRRAAGE